MGWFRRAITLSLIGVAIASCNTTEQVTNEVSTSNAVQAKSQELIPVKAGHLVALDMAPLFVGVESGCFEKNGLAVETVFFTNPGDNNAALAGGAIDFSTNPFTLSFFAANSGVPIKTIAAAWRMGCDAGNRQE